MGVPTISTVSPSSGPAAGQNLIRITGTNFATPTIVYSIPMEALAPRVAVTINGVAALRVDVLSSTQMDVLVPRYYGDPSVYPYPAVSITVTNLDEDGDPVPSETVTKTAAYTYVRWGLGPPRKDPPLLAVLRELLDRLLLEVNQHTSVRTHIDFGEEGVENTIALADIPSVNITVSFPEDREWGQWDNSQQEVELPDGTIDLYEGMVTYKIVCDVIVAGEGLREAMFLAEAIRDFAIKTPLLPVEADQDLYPGETHEYAVEGRGAEMAQGAGADQEDVIVMHTTLVVRGIPVMPDEPVENVKRIAEFIYAETTLPLGDVVERTYT